MRKGNMKNQLVEQLKTAILGNPWTSLMALAGTLVLAVYAKAMTPQQVLTLVIAILTAAGSADGGKGKDDA